jgi:hypothetical protein
LAFVSATALLLGAGGGLLACTVAVQEGSRLWSQMLAVGSALSIAAAIVGCVGIIVVRPGRPRI